MKIYQVDTAGYWTGNFKVVAEESGAPVGWVRDVPPDLKEGERAVWTGRWAVTTALPALDWPALIANRIAGNTAAYESAIGFLTRDYPPAEIQTWERQRAEVIAWADDNSAATPWIDIAASARGLDRGEYLLRTLAKVNAFAKASAFLTGRRQGIDDAIRAATTAEEINSVVIDYTLPGASVW